MKHLLFIGLALAAIATPTQATDFEAVHFFETEKAYFFDAPQANGQMPFYFPKRDIRLKEVGMDQGRVLIDAELFFQRISESEIAAVQSKFPAWEGLPVHPYYTYIVNNCKFNEERLNQIEASSPQPKRKGSWTGNYVDKFCGFKVKILDARTNREILAKAAADQSLISSGIEKHRVILKNAKIPTEIDATAIHRTLVDGFGGDAIAITESQALFLTGVAVAKVYKPEVVAALGLEQNDDALRKLLGMVFVDRGGAFSLKIGAPAGENPIVNVIGTKTINLDI